MDENLLKKYLKNPLDNSDLLIKLDAQWDKAPLWLPSDDIYRLIVNRRSIHTVFYSHLRRADLLRRRRVENLEALPFRGRSNSPLCEKCVERQKSLQKWSVKDFLLKVEAVNDTDIFTLEKLTLFPLCRLYAIGKHVFVANYLRAHVGRRKTNPMTNLELSQDQVAAISLYCDCKL